MVAEPRPGAMMLPKVTRTNREVHLITMAMVLVLLTPLVNGAHGLAKKEHYMEDHANGPYSMEHNSKQKRVGSRGENSVVKGNLNLQPEHAEGAGMAGNRTVMHGDELVGVRGGELERSNVVTAAISACDKARGLGCAINAYEMECAGEAHDGQCFSCDESPKEIGAQDGPAGRAGQFVVCFGGDDFGLSSVALRNMDDHNLEYVKK